MHSAWEDSQKQMHRQEKMHMTDDLVSLDKRLSSYVCTTTGPESLSFVISFLELENESRQSHELSCRESEGDRLFETCLLSLHRE